MATVVAAFTTSFHLTQGNIVAWSATISDSISLQGIEFSSMPSGLHSVEEDVIYFTQDSYDAVCVFKRRNTGEPGRKGIKMGAMGVMLAHSTYSRPWLHVPHLKKISTQEELQAYFDQHRAPSPTTNEAVEPFDWPYELAPPALASSSTNAPLFLEPNSSSHPLLHLPQLFRVMGPSFVTVFRHVLARRRVLIYTHVPVERACLLARTMVDLAYGPPSPDPVEALTAGPSRQFVRDSRPPTSLGIVGLIDTPKMESESEKAIGWIACTTDKIFLEKPHLYDLLVDLTTMDSPFFSLSCNLASSSVSPSFSRPSLYIVRTSSTQGRSVPLASKFSSPSLSLVRSTFSDLRIWGRMEKLMKETPALNGANCGNHAQSSSEGDDGRPSVVLCEQHSHTCQHGRQESSKTKSTSGWSSILPWRAYSYEDVCLVCASLLVGEGVKAITIGPSLGRQGDGGRILLTGEDDVLLNSGSRTGNQRLSWESLKPQEQMTMNQSPPTGSVAKPRPNPKRKSSSSSEDSVQSSVSSSTESSDSVETIDQRYGSFKPSVRTTLFLLDTFHDVSEDWLVGLEDILATNLTSRSVNATSTHKPPTVPISPSQVASLGLSTLSELDCKFVEWLAMNRLRLRSGEIRFGVKVKRSWKDLVGALIGW